MDSIRTLKTFIKEVLDGFSGAMPHNSRGNMRYDVAIRPKASGDEEFDVDYEPDPELKNSPYVDPKDKINEDNDPEGVKDGAPTNEAACVLIVSDDGKILAVSRKTDPNAFGMPGGKVDPGEQPVDAARRELEEECGLTANNLRQVFAHFDGNCTCYTFIGQITGEINTDESGVIRWVTPDVLLSGPFSDYNRLLFATVGIV